MAHDHLAQNIGGLRSSELPGAHPIFRASVRSNPAPATSQAPVACSAIPSPYIRPGPASVLVPLVGPFILQQNSARQEPAFRGDWNSALKTPARRIVSTVSIHPAGNLCVSAELPLIAYIGEPFVPPSHQKQGNPKTLCVRSRSDPMA